MKVRLLENDLDHKLCYESTMFDRHAEQYAVVFWRFILSNIINALGMSLLAPRGYTKQNTVGDNVLTADLSTKIRRNVVRFWSSEFEHRSQWLSLRCHYHKEVF